MFIPCRIERELTAESRGQLILGDAASELMPGPYAGKVQCVYIDPPFMTGKTFDRKRPFGEEDWRRGRLSLRLPAYADRFENRADYLAFLRLLIERSRELLCDSGVFYLHLDWRASAYARILCDEIFGEEHFLNEIIWSYESGGVASTHFPRKHDTILMYAKTADYFFDITRVPVGVRASGSNHMKRETDEHGRTFRSIRSGGKVYRYYDDEPVYPGDVWSDISHLQQRDPERSGYATQKPIKLLERLLKPVTRPGDLVCDLCCGSGTTLAAAAALGCRFIGVDRSSEALSIARSRLDIPCDLTAVTVDNGAELQAVREADGFRLLSFSAEHGLPKAALPLDHAEGWSAGWLEGDTLHVTASACRTHRVPELPSFVPPPGEAVPGIVITDAAGRRFGFRWQE